MSKWKKKLLSKCLHSLRTHSEAWKLGNSLGGETKVGTQTEASWGSSDLVIWRVTREPRPRLGCQLVNRQDSTDSFVLLMGLIPSDSVPNIRWAILVAVAFWEKGVTADKHIMTYQRGLLFRNRVHDNGQEFFGQYQFYIVSAGWRQWAFILYSYWQDFKVQEAMIITYGIHLFWISRPLVSNFLFDIPKRIMIETWLALLPPRIGSGGLMCGALFP